MIIQPSKGFDGSQIDGIAELGENLSVWATYLEKLDWQAGQRDESAWRAFLRAGSLGVDPQTAVELVTTKIKAAGGSYTPSKIQSQLRRAYTHVGSQENSVTCVSKLPKPQQESESWVSHASL